MSTLSFSFLPGVGFGVAAPALIAQSIGAHRPSDVTSIARIATGCAVVWMSAVALLLFACAPPILRLFTAEPAVIRIGVASLRVVALTQPWWAVILVQSGARRGTGNTRFSLIAGSSGIWSAVVLAWLAVHVTGGGLPLVWAAFLVTAPLTAVAISLRFRRSAQELEASPMNNRAGAQLPRVDHGRPMRTPVRTQRESPN